MKGLLADRVAIVTGAGRGLGRAHALSMASQGARVLVNDLDAAAAEEVCMEIARLGGEAVADSANVQDLDAQRVSPAVVALASEAAPNKCILLAGAGSFKLAHITMTQGVYLPDEQQAAEQILKQWDRIADRSGELVPATGFEQYRFEVAQCEDSRQR